MKFHSAVLTSLSRRTLRTHSPRRDLDWNRAATRALAPFEPGEVLVVATLSGTGGLDDRNGRLAIFEGAGGRRLLLQHGSAATQDRHPPLWLQMSTRNVRAESSGHFSGARRDKLLRELKVSDEDPLRLGDRAARDVLGSVYETYVLSTHETDVQQQRLALELLRATHSAQPDVTQPEPSPEVLGGLNRLIQSILTAQTPA